jgi:hypothetical protein
MLGTQLLSERMDGSLTGIAQLAWLAIAMTVAYSVIAYAIERRVRAQIAAYARAISQGSGRGAS